MFADRESVCQKAHGFELFPLNDNELEGDLPTVVELVYLRRGLIQAGGKLPLFDLDGQIVTDDVVQRCLARGWTEAWFNNPLKPDWLVCKLTEAGRRLAAEGV